MLVKVIGVDRATGKIRLSRTRGARQDSRRRAQLPYAFGVKRTQRRQRAQRLEGKGSGLGSGLFSFLVLFPSSLRWALVYSFNPSRASPVVFALAFLIFA